MSAPAIIDLQYLGIPKSIAAFVVFGPPPQRTPVLIETGPASTLSNLGDGLMKIGLKLEDIRHALVTHIHLDHAGAAGHLARNGTRIYVHEFGAKHLIDPTKLIESATRIYGDQMDRLWGTLLPVPEDQIRAVHDGDVIEIDGLRIEAIETPGHARHHHAFAIGDICFTGDMAGISVPSASSEPGRVDPACDHYITVPTPPPEFDLPAWHGSIDRIKALEFSTIYLTHFGACHDPAAHLDRLHALIDQHAEFVRHEMEMGIPRDEIVQRYIEWNRGDARDANINDADFRRYVSTNLLTMNVDGIMRYWTKTAERLTPPAPAT